MPKVFVSWSGARSKIVADAIYENLPVAIQSLEKVFLSSEMQKGIRWFEEIATELASTAFGIVCVTPENWAAPWLNFEAGAVSKQMDVARVMTILIGVEHTQITGPLQHFNHTATTYEDMRRLMETLNAALGPSGLSKEVLFQAFDDFWNKIEPAISAANAFVPDNAPPERSVGSMVEELLALVRSLELIGTVGSTRKALGAEGVRLLQAVEQPGLQGVELGLIVDVNTGVALTPEAIRAIDQIGLPWTVQEYPPAANTD